MHNHRHPERSEGPTRPESELGQARSLAALGMTERPGSPAFFHYPCA
jgi:hypothetical protein